MTDESMTDESLMDVVITREGLVSLRFSRDAIYFEDGRWLVGLSPDAVSDLGTRLLNIQDRVDRIMPSTVGTGWKGREPAPQNGEAESCLAHLGLWSRNEQALFDLANAVAKLAAKRK